MQSRWFCWNCLREWIHAAGWGHGDPCPICLQADVELVVYPSGLLNIPRDAAGHPLVGVQQTTTVVHESIPLSPLLTETFSGFEIW